MLSRTLKILTGKDAEKEIDLDVGDLIGAFAVDEPPSRPEPTIIRGPRIENTLASMEKARDGTQQILNDLLAEKHRIEHEIESTTIQLRAWESACEKMTSGQLDIPDILNHQ